MDLQTAIDTLKSFWSGGGDNYNDVISAMLVVINAGKDPAQRQQIASQNVFSMALLNEPSRQDEINQLAANPEMYRAIGAMLGTWWAPEWHTPRFLLLNGIKIGAMPGLFTLGDPLGVASWLGSVSVSGGAIEYTISADPDPEVRAEAMDLLIKVAFPLEWSTLVKSGLDKLDETLSASPFDQATRSVLAALSRRLRSRLYDVANAAAAAGFTAKAKTLQTPDGTLATLPPPPPRPWYKRIELWAGVLGGALAGGRAALHKSDHNP